MPQLSTQIACLFKISSHSRFALLVESDENRQLFKDLTGRNTQAVGQHVSVGDDLRNPSSYQTGPTSYLSRSPVPVSSEQFIRSFSPNPRFKASMSSVSHRATPKGARASRSKELAKAALVYYSTRSREHTDMCLDAIHVVERRFAALERLHAPIAASVGSMTVKSPSRASDEFTLFCKTCFPINRTSYSNLMSKRNTAAS
jgi:hypothetical protein